MRWADKLRNGIRVWLQMDPNPYAIHIREAADFELSAIRNRIWYRGDGNEIEQLYQQSLEYADKYKFWASKCTQGMEMRKIHTGLPALIIRTLTSVVMADMGVFEFEDERHNQLWQQIDESNKFRQKLEKSVKDTLCVGDGAWKISIDVSRSQYPILRWYPGDRVEFVYDGEELDEVIFKTPYLHDRRQYTLCEHYGHGYIRSELYYDDKQVDLSALNATKDITDWIFDKSVILAVPFKVYDSTKFEGRGGSIFDGKLDSFDAFDEVWSQWMDALRAGRAKTYIPECLIPRDPNTGSMLKPNAFDNRFISAGDDMSEGAKNQINTEQPAIPHDSYLASYVTALDLCLQGVISPSTLGIDTKKLDNAEAQREKEKTTLYTRNAIVGAIQNTVPELVQAAINGYRILIKQPLSDVAVDIQFGEYANPSFESQIETVGKGHTQGIMSVEACVDELYGSTKDESWKAQEVARLKAEQGIAELDESSAGDDWRGAPRIGF